MGTLTVIANETVLERAALPGSQVDNEMVFFNHETGSYFATGPVGAEIWSFLGTPRTFQDVCEHLTVKFDVDHETCVNQVGEFLSDMINEGILKAQN